MLNLELGSRGISGQNTLNGHRLVYENESTANLKCAVGEEVGWEFEGPWGDKDL